LAHKKGLLVILLCLFCLPALYAEFEIDAQADKTEVAFGDSLKLQITVSQQLEPGQRTARLTPNVSEIPGFDIASSRAGHSTSFVNNYGVARSQVVYELVPQGPGKKTIPAITFTDPDGNVHRTKPIEINVLPPQETPAAQEDGRQDEDEASENSGAVFKLIIAAGFVFVFLLAIPFVLSALSAPEKKSGFVGSAENSAQSAVEDAEIVSEPVKTIKAAPPARKIDFFAAVADLKKNSANVDREFYRQYFALFKEASASGSSRISEDLTYDELLEIICEAAGSKKVKDAARSLAKDIEMVMYAGGLPSRGFAAIEEDIKLLLMAME
jgi:hypothetical protein